MDGQGPDDQPNHRQRIRRNRPQRRRRNASEAQADAVAGSGAATGTGSGTERAAGPGSADRSLRSLVSTRSTQVSPTAAMRAREVARPTQEDLAQAEDEVVLVRRNYTPPTPLIAGRRSGRSRQARRGARPDKPEG